MVLSSPNIRWFETIRLEDVPLVGGKNASLGELYCELGEVGVKIPKGFALTVAAYADALSSAKAWPGLHELLDDLDIADVTLLASRLKAIADSGKATAAHLARKSDANATEFNA